MSAVSCLKRFKTYLLSATNVRKENALKALMRQDF